jgi:Tfp pilus assembly protein PilZ
MKHGGVEDLEGSAMSTDKRHAKRVSVRLRVDCKPLSNGEIREILDGQGYQELAYSSLALSRPRQGMLPSRVRDLSLSGLRMEGPLPLGLGDAAALDVHLPDERVALKALAEVVWSQPADALDRPHACGLRFAAMDEDSARRLRSFIDASPCLAAC